ncbi:hypothetical protein GCM10022207_50900 [Streptomyces lannensis]|uniref:Uncharacterized protein n=1 Tax=Streptomyces lannensis TaxID=766498 RepID=A0ABP7KI90_9ACTN
MRRRENDDATRTQAGGGRSGQRRSRPEKPSAGARLLLSIGLQHPELLLTGPALRDQGQVVTAMLERLSEQPTRRTKALPGAKYSPDEFTHFPDQPADHDTESSRA